MVVPWDTWLSTSMVPPWFFTNQASALRHRIPGVDRQVHEDLLKLRRIGFHGEVAVLTAYDRQ